MLIQMKKLQNGVELYEGTNRIVKNNYFVCMRKWIVLLFVLLLAAFGIFYLLTPKRNSFKQQEQISFSSKAFSRALFDEATWQRWWPCNKINTTGFRYNGNSFFI